MPRGIRVNFEDPDDGFGRQLPGREAQGEGVLDCPLHVACAAFIRAKVEGRFGLFATRLQDAIAVVVDVSLISLKQDELQHGMSVN